MHVPPWRHRRQIQGAPPMHTDATQSAKYSAGFVLSVRPQLCQAARKLKIGSSFPVFHATKTGQQPPGEVEQNNKSSRATLIGRRASTYRRPHPKLIAD